jgi:hypothetical protein
MESNNTISPTTISKVCARPGCGHSFEPKAAQHKYCSDYCKNKVLAENKKNRLGSVQANEMNAQSSQPATQGAQTEAVLYPEIKRPEIKLPEDKLGPLAMVIVDHYKEDGRYWRDEYNTLRRKHEKLFDDKVQLEKEIDKLKRDVADAETNPKGLNGLGQNPLVMEITRHVMPHAGQAFGMLMMAAAQKAAGAAGMVQSPDQQMGSVSGYGHHFNEFMAVLPPNVQESVWEFFQVLGSLRGDPEQIDYLVKAFIEKLQSR